MCLGCFQIPELNKYANQVFHNAILFFFSHWMEGRTDGSGEWLLLIPASLVIERPSYLNFVQGLWEMQKAASLCNGPIGPSLCQTDGCLLFDCFLFINSVNLCHSEKQDIIHETILRDFNHRGYKCPTFKWINDNHKTYLLYLAHRHCIL